MRKSALQAFVIVALLSGGAHGQSTDSAFTDLRRYANGIEALRTVITEGFVNITADRALTVVAARARLNLTFDSRIPELRTTLMIAAHSRSAAVALIEIAEAAALRVRVSPSEQIVVTSVAAAVVAARDSARATARLPAVRTEARRVERQQFESQPNVGAIAVTGSALRSAPVFVEPDVLRAVQMLPGIAARSDYAAGFNVRGGENDQNLILIDGFPIYNPYHFGGVFSTFIDPTVGGVSLYRGSLPARYGGRLSGVLDVTSAEPGTAGAHGMVEVSLVSSTASVGSAFADGDGSWLVAGRRTYADAMANVVFQQNVFPYHFQDVHGHVARRFSNGLRVALTAYDGLDVMAPNRDSDVGASWGNAVVGLSVAKHVEAPRLFGWRFADSLMLEQRASLTRFDSRVDVPDYLFHAVDRLTEHRLAGSLTVSHARSTQTFGYELSDQRLAFVSNAVYADLGDLIPMDSTRQRSRAASVYADQIWRPTASLIVQGGVRVDAVNAGNWLGVLPRASVKYFLTPNMAVSVAAGRYAQWMHSLGREEEPFQPLQFWVASDSVTPVSTASDATVGVERWLSPLRLLHVEAFYKRYDDALAPNAYNDPGVHGDEFLRTTGTSYGLDVMLRQLEGGPFSGWVAYSYGLSTRRRPDGINYFPSQDRRHNLNLVGSWHSGAYTYAARANLASGLPHTPVLGAYTRERYNPVTRFWVPDPTSPKQQNISGEIGSLRLPWYDRIDLSVTRASKLFGKPAAPYLSILNVLNAHNPAAYVYDYSFGGKREAFPNLPFVPTVGVSIVY